ncbi:fimbrial protein [Lelliottia nimipressuralis]
MNRLKGVAMLAAAAIIPPALATSNQTGDTVTYSFKGVLQAMTPCQVNGDQVIEVPFGNVGINKVESGIYIKDINYTLNCGSAGASNTILMTLRAPTVGASDSAIDTGVPGLWATFTKDDQPLSLNKEFKVDDGQNPPRLRVQLVKDPNTDFTEGSFSISATLTANYM